MINITETWIPQIIAYAEIIIDAQALRRCWLLGECRNSVTSYDELIEQVFDDLDADNVSSENLSGAAVPPAVRLALLGFIECLKILEEQKFAGHTRDDMARILASDAWNITDTSARSLVKISKYYGLRRA